jgi:HK97 family phage major capsid protein
MTKINVRELSLLTQEYNTLTEVRKWTPQQKQRAAYLQSAIAAVKAGASLAEIEQDQHNELEVRNGLPVTQFANKNADHAEARAWQSFVRGEKRDMGEGAPMLSQIGTYTSIGYFVPTSFFPQLFAALKAHDVLFDDDACTVIRTTNGRVLRVPVAADTANVASVVSESGSESSVDIDSTGHAVLGAYTYRTPRFVVSLEAFDDLDSSMSAVKLFKQFSLDRLARGIGADLVTGNGSGKPNGLISSLVNLGVLPVVAAGSSPNDGIVGNTGANSLGSPDFAAAFNQLDQAYANSPKVAWLMNRSTLATVSGQLDKYGQLLNLVKYVDGQPQILGIPVKICPSMDSIGASKTPVILGDLSYWATRLVVDDNAGVTVYTNAPGLAENGNVGLRCFARADGALLYQDSDSPSPFVMIQNHS